MKKVLRMVAMVMVMLTFSMTAFAAETGEVTGDVKVERSKSTFFKTKKESARQKTMSPDSFSS